MSLNHYVYMGVYVNCSDRICESVISSDRRCHVHPKIITKAKFCAECGQSTTSVGTIRQETNWLEEEDTTNFYCITNGAYDLFGYLNEDAIKVLSFDCSDDTQQNLDSITPLQASIDNTNILTDMEEFKKYYNSVELKFGIIHHHA